MGVSTVAEATGWVLVGTTAIGAVTFALASGWLTSLAYCHQDRPWYLAPVPTAVVGGAVLAGATLAGMVLLPALALPGFLFAVAAAGAACLVDAAAHRLPNVLVLRCGGAGLAAMLLAVVVSGGEQVLGVVLGAVIAGGVTGALALAYPPGLGLGDVKLAALLGALALTPLGAAGMLLVAWLVGGLLALTLLALRRVQRHTTIAFGPMLLLGAAASLGVQALGTLG